MQYAALRTQRAQPPPAQPPPATEPTAVSLAVAVPQTSATAVTAMILGILGVVGMVFVVGLLCALPAVIFGHVARCRIRQANGALQGRGFATAGLAMGYTGLVVSLLALGTVLTVAVRYYHDAFPPGVRQQIRALNHAGPRESEDAVFGLLSNGKQAEAEELLDVLARRFPTDQRLAYIQALCSYSRFSRARAAAQFQGVITLGPATAYGCAAHLAIELGEQRNVEANMKGLHLLVEQQPQNPYLLWTLAIACRNFYKHTGTTTYSAEGERCYRQLLAQFAVGPVLVHQTFANIMDEQDKYEESLVHRRIAVQQEPSSWTYGALGATLNDMKRYQEAEQAYTQAVSFDDRDPQMWASLAWVLDSLEKHAPCIAACQKALALDPGSVRALRAWGWTLEQQGHSGEAVALYKKALAVNPTDAYTFGDLIRIARKQGHEPEAKQWEERMRGATVGTTTYPTPWETTNNVVKIRFYTTTPVPAR